jgi:tetratricopeptide (TPR) repeat protein
MIVFAGHGDTDAAGQGFLELNDDGELLRFNEIWYGLRKAVRSGLQLALFNSCFGLGLLAQNLQDDAQIPHMIVMRDLVPDAIAQAFLNYFLQDFVAGEPIPVAANRARERLQALEPQYPCATWLPVIWQNPYALPLGLGVNPEAGKHGSNQTMKDEGAIASPTLRSYWPKSILITCGLLGAGLLIFFGGRSSVAQWLNDQGVQASRQDQLLTAQRYFEIARRLDPRYPQPRYNLGFLYDQRWGRREEAIAHYEAAAYLDHPAAIAEYIRFKLLNGDTDYGPMLTLIKRCLDRAEYPSIRVSCLKNKGWIRVRQQRWTWAEAHLNEAIALLDQSAHTHCLLAQTLEAQGQTAQALPHWQKTLELGREEIDEHDRCLGVAETRLLTFDQDASPPYLHTPSTD